MLILAMSVCCADARVTTSPWCRQSRYFRRYFRESQAPVRRTMSLHRLQTQQSSWRREQSLCTGRLRFWHEYLSQMPSLATFSISCLIEYIKLPTCRLSRAPTFEASRGRLCVSNSSILPTAGRDNISTGSGICACAVVFNFLRFCLSSFLTAI